MFCWLWDWEIESIVVRAVLQDAILLQFNQTWYRKNRTVAWARAKLKALGIVGLCEAPYLRGLLERLPTILQDQHRYEKVSSAHVHAALLFVFRTINSYIYEESLAHAWLLCIEAGGFLSEEWEQETK